MSEAPTTANGQEEEGGLRRRELLIAGGVITALGVAEAMERRANWASNLLAKLDAQPLTIDLLRPEDFLALQFEFHNLRIQGSELVRETSGDAFVVVVFPPQSIAEEAFFEATPGVSEKGKPSNSETPSQPPVRSRLAGPTRLAFLVAPNTSSVSFDDETLLTWSRFTPSIAQNARFGNGQGQPAPPAATTTAIEYPWKLVLSTNENSGWKHALGPVTRDGRTEIWHTRLGTRSFAVGPDGLVQVVSERNTPSKSMRAIWSEGFQHGNLPSEPANPEPFRTGLSKRDRHQIVALSSDFNLGQGYSPSPARARKFIMSALGATSDLAANFNGFPSSYSLLQWEHRGTMARDHFVKVVNKGYLYPTGHEASLVTITERKIQAEHTGKPVAYLRQRAFIIIKQPLLDFSSNNHMPFDSIEVVTSQTPDLDPFDGSKAAAETKIVDFGKLGFWPRVGGEDFKFALIGRDAEGAAIEFSAPLIWLDNTLANGVATKVNQVVAHYSNAVNNDRRRRPLGGQELAFAPPLEGETRSTAFKTDMYELGGLLDKSAAPKWKCYMANARIKIPALETVGAASAAGGGTGGGSDEPAGTLVKMAKNYINEGFHETKNAAQAYLETAEDAALDYGNAAAGDLCGAIGQPNMDIAGLSRTLGNIGELDPSDFNPANFLKGAKFLGIDFFEILQDQLPFPLPSMDPAEYEAALKKLPSTIEKKVYDEADAALEELESRLPKEIRLESLWEPELKESDLFVPRGPGGDAYMRLHTLTVVPLNLTDPSAPAGSPTYDVEGRIENFAIRLLSESNPFLTLFFNRLTFEAHKGTQPKIEVDIAEVEFDGPLAFVDELRDYIKNPENGITLDVSAKGVEAGYTLALPKINVGAFSLQNMAISTGITIPFTGEKVAGRFAFCSREEPFLLTYSIFGGGGFAAIEVTPDGVKSLEISLEFGAAASVDFGVASGSVSIMAGIYFKMSGDEVSLTGFVRLNGELDVLGLISASLEFNVSLTYDGKELWGQATLTVEVDVALYSGSVEITCEKTFARSGASDRALGEGSARRGPAPAPAQITFKDLFTTVDPWQEYSNAFASQAF